MVRELRVAWGEGRTGGDGMSGWWGSDDGGPKFDATACCMLRLLVNIKT